MTSIPVLISPKEGKEPSPRTVSHGHDRLAARMLWVAGYVFLLGTLIDLGILWLGQRQSGLQWEFVALSNTVPAWPRLVLALGLMYAAAHIGRSQEWVFRVLGLLTLIVGLGAAAVGTLAVLNTLTIWKTVTADAGMEIKTTAVKTLALSALYVLLLVPVGLMGLRRSRN